MALLLPRPYRLAPPMSNSVHVHLEEAVDAADICPLQIVGDYWNPSPLDETPYRSYRSEGLQLQDRMLDNILH